MEKSNSNQETAENVEVKTDTVNKGMLEFYLLILKNFQLLDYSPETGIPFEVKDESIFVD